MIGGPGTLFWMVICTIFTSIFSLIENTIGMRYRKVIDNEYRGGSPYYIFYGLKNKFLALVFSFFLVLSSTIFFLPIQVRGIFISLDYLFPVNKVILIISLILFSIIVMFRGTKVLANFTKVIVPIMTTLFLSVSVFSLIINIKKIDDVFIKIINDALSVRAFLTSTVVVGIKRSLFSNEAGLGTSPSINAMSDNLDELGQGYLQVLTCFIDTVIMCVLQGFVILLYDIKYIDKEIAIYVYEIIFMKYGKYIGASLLFFFSLATIVSGYYSGESNALFTTIILNIKTKTVKRIYQILFIIGLIIGVFASNNGAWSLIDYGLIILGITNIIVIIILEEDFKNALKKKDY